DVFQDGIKRIREMMMNVHLIGDANSQRHLIQLLYADVITTLETYLVQVYLKKVFESDETIINFLNNHNDLKAKFNSIDLTDLMKGDAKAIIEQRCDDLNKHIQNLSWHNPVAVSNRFDKVDIKIDLAKTGLKELIQNRHDIIHRSGKSIEGRPFGSFNKGDIEKSIVIVVGIAEEIDRLAKVKA
ncbi:HEPN domain-containing protein, partial [Aeromonas salmonicida]